MLKAKEKPITSDQIRLIKTVQRKNQTDDEYREMLKSRFFVTSCTQLTCRQAVRLIDLYKMWGWCVNKNKSVKRQQRRKSKPRLPENTITIASHEQHKKIAALCGLIHWHVKDGFSRWIVKSFSIKRVKTADQAYRVIEGLKKMFEHQMEKEYGPAWQTLDYEDQGIRRYIEEHC